MHNAVIGHRGGQRYDVLDRKCMPNFLWSER
jgi:hypothetical protein